jgi:hypothetical protein
VGGTAFVALIKMLIAPVIFCTIVLGIGAVRQAASVSRIGGLALSYFLLMSTVALAIGRVVGNLLQPGEGLRLSGESPLRPVPDDRRPRRRPTARPRPGPCRPGLCRPRCRPRGSVLATKDRAAESVAPPMDCR